LGGAFFGPKKAISCHLQRRALERSLGLSDRHDSHCASDSISHSPITTRMAAHTGSPVPAPAPPAALAPAPATVSVNVF